MKIKTNITTEREVDVLLPLFRLEKRIFENQGYNYFAVLPDETVIDLFISGDLTIIKHWTAERMSSDIMRRMEWEEISEEMFLAAHRKALNDLSLVPKLSEVDQEIEDELNRAKDDLKDINAFNSSVS